MHNQCTNGKMGTVNANISDGGIIFDPDPSFVWYIESEDNSDTVSLYNASSDKYIKILSTSTFGFGLSSEAETFFNLLDDENIDYGVRIQGTGVSTKFISIYTTSFVLYTNTSRKPLYLYKLNEDPRLAVLQNNNTNP